jgi:hypothetical protein
MMMSPNQILDVVNGYSILNRIALAVFLTWFLLIELKDPYGIGNAVGESRSRIVDMRDIRRYGICLGTALAMWAYGAGVLTIGVHLWRDEGMLLGVAVMVLGTAMTTLSNLWIIAECSIHRYGHIIWLFVLGVNVLYTLTAWLVV